LTEFTGYKVFFAENWQKLQKIVIITSAPGLNRVRIKKKPVRDRKLLRLYRFFKYLFGPGADVMIAIFFDFCQFFGKNIAVFLKTNVMIKILPNLALI
jgi:hypothetical protein